MSMLIKKLVVRMGLTDDGIEGELVNCLYRRKGKMYDRIFFMTIFPMGGRFRRSAGATEGTPKIGRFFLPPEESHV